MRLVGQPQHAYEFPPYTRAEFDAGIAGVDKMLEFSAAETPVPIALGDLCRILATTYYHMGRPQPTGDGVVVETVEVARPHPVYMKKTEDGDWTAVVSTPEGVFTAKNPVKDDAIRTAFDQAGLRRIGGPF